MTTNMLTFGASGFDFFERRASVLSLKPLAYLARRKLFNVIYGDVVFVRYVFPMHTGDVISQDGYKYTVRNSSSPVTSLGGAVNHIESVIAKNEMFRVDTPSIVAGMANKRTFWYFPVSHFVGHAMRKLFANVGVYGKHPISFVVLVGLPFPTFIFGLYGNLGPKSFCKHFLSMMGFPSYVKREV